MRRSDHPSRPSAITCCRFSALKTLAIPAAGVQPTAQVNVSAPGAALAGFQVSINGRFWVSTEGLTYPTRGADNRLRGLAANGAESRGSIKAHGGAPDILAPPRRFCAAPSRGAP